MTFQVFQDLRQQLCLAMTVRHANCSTVAQQ